MSLSVSLKEWPHFRCGLSPSSLPTLPPHPLAKGATPLLVLPFSTTVPLPAICMSVLYSGCFSSLGAQRRTRLRGGGSNPPPSARWLPGEARAATRHCRESSLWPKLDSGTEYTTHTEGKAGLMTWERAVGRSWEVERRTLCQGATLLSTDVGKDRGSECSLGPLRPARLRV